MEVGDMTKQEARAEAERLTGRFCEVRECEIWYGGHHSDDHRLVGTGGSFEEALAELAERIKSGDVPSRKKYAAAHGGST